MHTDHVKLNNSPIDNSLLVKHTNIGTVNGFLAVCLVSWGTVRVQRVQYV